MKGITGMYIVERYELNQEDHNADGGWHVFGRTSHREHAVLMRRELMDRGYDRDVSIACYHTNLVKEY